MTTLHPLDLQEVGLALRAVVPPTDVSPGARELLGAANVEVPTDAYAWDASDRCRGLDPDRIRAERLVRELERRGFEIRRTT